jgi:hypothetical protein
MISTAAAGALGEFYLSPDKSAAHVALPPLEHVEGNCPLSDRSRVV